MKQINTKKICNINLSVNILEYEKIGPEILQSCKNRTGDGVIIDAKI